MPKSENRHGGGNSKNSYMPNFKKHMVEIPQILSYMPNFKKYMVEDPKNLPIIPAHIKLTSQNHNESSKTSDYASLLFFISA